MSPHQIENICQHQCQRVADAYNQVVNRGQLQSHVKTTRRLEDKRR